METRKNSIYKQPEIKQIQLDNEISLVLQSELPPTFEGKNNLETPSYFNSDPFKINVG